MNTLFSYLFCHRNLCLSYNFLDRNVRSVFFSSLESYDTIHQCVQRMISTDTYVLTRMMNCTSLAYKDVTSFRYFTTKKFNT